MKIKPKHQTVISGKNQDCLRACICSLLNLRTKDVPNFVEVEDETWWTEMQKFIHKHGYNLVVISLGANIPWHSVVEIPAIFFGEPGDFTGKEDTKLHAIVGVCRAGEIEPIHDPHPMQPGLKNITAVAVMVPILTV